MTRDPFRRRDPHRDLASRIARRLAPATMLGAHGAAHPGSPKSLLRMALTGAPLEAHLATRVSEREVADPAIRPSALPETLPMALAREPSLDAVPGASPTDAPPTSATPRQAGPAAETPSPTPAAALPRPLPFTVEQVRAALERPAARESGAAPELQTASTPRTALEPPVPQELGDTRGPQVGSEQPEPAAPLSSAPLPAAAIESARPVRPTVSSPRGTPPSSAPAQRIMRRSRLEELPPAQVAPPQAARDDTPPTLTVADEPIGAPSHQPAALASDAAAAQPATMPNLAPAETPAPLPSLPTAPGTPAAAQGIQRALGSDGAPAALPPDTALEQEPPESLPTSPVQPGPTTAPQATASSAPPVRRTPSAEDHTVEPGPALTTAAEGQPTPPVMRAEPLPDAVLRPDDAQPASALRPLPTTASLDAPSSADRANAASLNLASTPADAYPVTTAPIQRPVGISRQALPLAEDVSRPTDSAPDALAPTASPAPVSSAPTVQRTPRGLGPPATPAPPQPSAPVVASPAPLDLGARYRAALDDYRQLRAAEPTAQDKHETAEPDVLMPQDEPSSVEGPLIQRAIAPAPRPGVGVRSESSGETTPARATQPAPLEQALFGEQPLQRAVTMPRSMRPAPTMRSAEPSVSAPEPAVQVQYIRRAGEQESATAESATAEADAPAEGAQPQEIDLNRLTDQVYQRLRRRLQVEAERLGWSGRR